MQYAIQISKFLVPGTFFFINERLLLCMMILNFFIKTNQALDGKRNRVSNRIGISPKSFKMEKGNSCLIAVVWSN